MEQLKRETWKRFVQEGTLDTSRMEKRIAESWFHCRQTGVDPYNGKGVLLLNGRELEERKQKNSRLIQVAMPFLQNLAKMYEQLNVVLLLADRDGYVLRMMGNTSAYQIAKDINFTEGVKWTEEEVGTNAIGTAISTTEPITITGVEHYSVASQNWSCSASPIYDEDGELLGVLDISSPFSKDTYEHILGTVVAAAYAIENKWKKQMKEEEVELLSWALESPASTPYILCNRKHKIVYIHSDLKDYPVQVGKTLQEYSSQGIIHASKTPILSKGTEDMIGYNLQIQAPKQSVQKHSITNESVSFEYPGVKGKSLAFQKTIHEAKKASRTDVTVHLHGETGTGKEMLAQSIHQNSTRKKGRFIAVNCGAIPENLLESELFGYADGAFTGARRSGKEGKIKQADGGTLFLDEIGEIPPSMQITLLRALQEKQVAPIGGDQTVSVDFRLITATNKDLRKLVKELEKIYFIVCMCSQLKFHHYVRGPMTYLFSFNIFAKRQVSQINGQKSCWKF
ncbi:sigma-54-dependent Fis family transcriptional regulator [Alteribacillus bidgolensis]|uniref:Transcriptional regulator of acetoin/glycerol metabolism n=1 Tax=Alteribacillus bidgolensis TaxID=930129 RepID=A0A1G8IFA2_9BACI|nr:sigma-54-dependent Fis family transcriptional regulator [Alteribacillus bidgolensis]SDI17698.1 Transcriptional regulator of acetoin/glycerol metabolism [Alteribacillus bidgolensis]